MGVDIRDELWSSRNRVGRKTKVPSIHARMRRSGQWRAFKLKMGDPEMLTDQTSHGIPHYMRSRLRDVEIGSGLKDGRCKPTRANGR